jgi:uroporphyrinogen-III synthase
MIECLLPMFDGLRVLSLESRRAREIGALISNFGGVPFVAPALREVPLESNTEALAFATALLRGDFDAVVFLTGVGMRALMTAIVPVCSREQFETALRQVKVIARGPKPLAVLRELTAPVWLAAPEPNTWRELLAAIDQRATEWALAGARVAVQEYGVSNDDLIDGLRARGAHVTRVPVYRWALPEDLAPLKAAAAALARREIDVALFTTGVQITHLWDIASRLQLEAKVKAGLEHAVIGSIGPTTSEALRRHGLTADLEASHPKMGVLVTEAAARAWDILRRRASVRNS